VNPNKALWEKGDFTRIAESMRESGEASQNTSSSEEVTSIPATFLRVAVAV
jgi:hypothetical protein